MKDSLDGKKMGTVIRGEKSELKDVTGGVTQGLGLVPVMFIVYINDLSERITSYMNMFADDDKLQRRITDGGLAEVLQSDLEKMYYWSQKWQ